MSSSSVSQDLLAQERDANFKSWVQSKAVRDKAFEVLISNSNSSLLLLLCSLQLLIDNFIVMIQYLKKLNPTRAASEDSLKDVAISLCAVDRLLGNDENGNSATSAVLSTTNSLQVCGSCEEYVSTAAIVTNQLYCLLYRRMKLLRKELSVR